MKGPKFQSASGLRPASAYLFVGVVLAVVCGRAWVLANDQTFHQPRGTERVDHLPTPDFDIADREGRVFAQSVQCMDLVLSPRSMWQAHTPRLMAAAIVPFLDGRLGEEELLRRFLPDAPFGTLKVRDKNWVLDYKQAERFDAWSRSLGIEASLWLEEDARRPRWRLSWRPAELLSTEVREANGREDWSPLRWTRLLADGLLQVQAPITREERQELTWKELEERRALVWEALMPCANTVAVEDLPAESVVDLMGELDRQGVAGHQMSIRFEQERAYSIRSSSPRREAFEVMGSWRYPSEKQALAMAMAEGARGKDLTRRARVLLDYKQPGSGLELVASKVLAEARFDWIQPRAASYDYRRLNAVHQKSRRYFDSDVAADATPQVTSTLDSELQGFLYEQLAETNREHRAAMVMGIVVEVQSGDVLAVGGLSDSPVSEFLPTRHLFVPGSTFKVVVMATALEAGVVSFDESFDTFNGHYRIPGSIRTIHEAEGAPTGEIPAWEGLSRSVNAVLVQIGMRIPEQFFHEHLLALGYQSVLGAGVGKESAGRIPDLPWSPAYAHASVSFGHELTITLWQHAGALATILRGGVRLPLRVVSGVSWGDEQMSLPLEVGERVYRKDVCASVRTMLAEGARTGTGRRISAREAKLGTPIELLSKTGTTEKEDGVVCLHKEFKRNALNAKLPLGREDPNFITFNAIKAEPNPHERSCYTSSICLVGRVVGEEREVMVLLVVEEPRSTRRFGSEVAGPAAIAILKEALGLTRGGVTMVEKVAVEQDYGYDSATERPDEPWRLRYDDDAYGEYESESLDSPGSAR